MKRLSGITACVGLVLGGCANTSGNPDSGQMTTYAGVGAAAGCIGGALLSKLAGGNAGTGCAAGAVVGGLVGYEKARRDEIDAAKAAAEEAATATATLPANQQARVGEVKTVQVTATDKATHETRKYDAFDSVSVDLPVASKGSPEFDAAMEKLKVLAERVADERGSSEIVVAVTPQDAKAYKLSLQGGTVNTSKGNAVKVTKIADALTPAGTERVTVKATPLPNAQV